MIELTVVSYRAALVAFLGVVNFCMVQQRPTGLEH